MCGPYRAQMDTSSERSTPRNPPPPREQRFDPAVGTEAPATRDPLHERSTKPRTIVGRQPF
jgi:hypothetical protein